MLCTLAVVLAAAAPADVDDVPVFEAPVRLRAGGAFLGHDQLYPSPALHDLDGDGVAELIVGDLVGNLKVSKRLPGDDPTAWSEPEPLKGADGEPLKFDNW